ncbi:MAG: TfoX/Sxy family protein [Formivibrio sp.]|nr:TfoX/Sxy family protein [Formivibrio sp.]
MPRRSEYVDWLFEQLAPLGTLRARAMFGAFGLYCDDLFFAIVDDDVLYIKVDDVCRSEFEAEGLRPFTYPMKDGTTSTLSYYPLPDFSLENQHELVFWAKKGLAAALRAKNSGKKR